MSFAPGLFGRHVGRRAQDLTIDRHRDLACLALRQPKIGDVRFAGGIHHDVAGLQIAMDDARLVGRVQGVSDLDAQLGGFPQSELPLGEPFLQAASLDEVADDVQRVPLAADFVNADDTRMLHLGGRPGLANEHLGVWAFESGPCAEF